MSARFLVGLRSALVAIGAAVLVYGAACGFVWSIQRQLIFFPQAEVTRTPADVAVDYGSMRVPVNDDSALEAWWLPAHPEVATPPVVLYLRGNDGNLGWEVDRLRALHEYGVAVLAIDYRGYGRSDGPPPSEVQVYEDAVAAWDFLVGARGIRPHRIVVYGHSLGGAVAAELALRRGPACALVLEATFTTMADMGRLQYPWLPVDRLLRERFETEAKLGQLDLPVIVVHGTADDLVPFAMGERLYRAARGDRHWVPVPGAGHEQAMPMAGPPLVDAIARVARRCAAS